MTLRRSPRKKNARQQAQVNRIKAAKDKKKQYETSRRLSDVERKHLAQIAIQRKDREDAARERRKRIQRQQNRKVNKPVQKSRAVSNRSVSNRSNSVSGSVQSSPFNIFGQDIRVRSPPKIPGISPINAANPPNPTHPSDFDSVYWKKVILTLVWIILTTVLGITFKGTKHLLRLLGHGIVALSQAMWKYNRKVTYICCLFLFILAIIGNVYFYRVHTLVQYKLFSAQHNTAPFPASASVTTPLVSSPVAPAPVVGPLSWLWNLVPTNPTNIEPSIPLSPELEAALSSYIVKCYVLVKGCATASLQYMYNFVLHLLPAILHIFQGTAAHSEVIVYGGLALVLSIFGLLALISRWTSILNICSHGIKTLANIILSILGSAISPLKYAIMCGYKCCCKRWNKRKPFKTGNSNETRIVNNININGKEHKDIKKPSTLTQTLHTLAPIPEEELHIANLAPELSDIDDEHSPEYSESVLPTGQKIVTPTQTNEIYTIHTSVAPHPTSDKPPPPSKPTLSVSNPINVNNIPTVSNHPHWYQTFEKSSLTPNPDNIQHPICVHDTCKMYINGESSTYPGVYAVACSRQCNRKWTYNVQHPTALATQHTNSIINTLGQGLPKLTFQQNQPGYRVQLYDFVRGIHKFLINNPTIHTSIFKQYMVNTLITNNIRNDPSVLNAPTTPTALVAIISQYSKQTLPIQHLFNKLVTWRRKKGQTLRNAAREVESKTAEYFQAKKLQILYLPMDQGSFRQHLHNKLHYDAPIIQRQINTRLRDFSGINAAETKLIQRTYNNKEKQIQLQTAKRALGSLPPIELQTKAIYATLREIHDEYYPIPQKNIHTEITNACVNKELHMVQQHNQRNNNQRYYYKGNGRRGNYRPKGSPGSAIPLTKPRPNAAPVYKGKNTNNNRNQSKNKWNKGKQNQQRYIQNNKYKHYPHGQQQQQKKGNNNYKQNQRYQRFCQAGKDCHYARCKLRHYCPFGRMKCKKNMIGECKLAHSRAEYGQRQIKMGQVYCEIGAQKRGLKVEEIRYIQQTVPQR